MQAQVKAATGRDLLIGGGAKLELSLHPRLVVNQISVSNAPWAGGVPLATAKQIGVQFDLQSLLSGRYKVTKAGASASGTSESDRTTSARRLLHRSPLDASDRARVSDRHRSRAYLARLGPALVAVLATALGITHGWLNGAGITAAGREASALFGIAATIFVVLALASALVVSLRRPWTRIAVRVTGSWFAAVGLLTLGWGLRAAVA